MSERRFSIDDEGTRRARERIGAIGRRLVEMGKISNGEPLETVDIAHLSELVALTEELAALRLFQHEQVMRAAAELRTILTQRTQ